MWLSVMSTAFFCCHRVTQATETGRLGRDPRTLVMGPQHPGGHDGKQPPAHFLTALPATVILGFGPSQVHHGSCTICPPIALGRPDGGGNKKSVGKKCPTGTAQVQ